MTVDDYALPITVPPLSSQREKTALASAMNRHINSSVLAGSAFATWSIMARRAFRVLDQGPPVLPVNEESGARDVVSHLRTSLATSLGFCAPANSKRRRPFAAARCPC